MRDFLNEIFASMQSNKQRIALTGFSIGWGMFILVVLLGSAGGLQKGLYSTLHLDMPQRIQLQAGITSMPWQGLATNRTTEITLPQAQALYKKHFQHVENVYPVYSHGAMLVRNSNCVSSSITGGTPGYIETLYNKITDGRDLDDNDVTLKRKVCVISVGLSQELFADTNPIGKDVSIDGLSYTVVGICASRWSNDNTIETYVPITTALGLYSPRSSALTLLEVTYTGIQDIEESDALIASLRGYLAPKMKCDPKDNKALRITNKFEGLMGLAMMLRYLAVFVWIIGIATLMAGIVGVSNIMLITVKERTRELGVRRAMGASNNNIIALVLAEAVIITMIFGYMGMMIGVGLTQLLSALLGDNIPVFNHPVVQFGAIIGCNVIMILAGMLAGYVPAKRAISVKLVDALSA